MRLFRNDINIQNNAAEDNNQKMKWKTRNYNKWKYSYPQYQEIPDSVRQNVLLNYFKEINVIPYDTSELTQAIMHKIKENPVISDPSEIGKASSQNHKRLGSLRQCFTAEVLYMTTSKFHSIGSISKELVMRHSDEMRESDRRKKIIELGGNDMLFSCQDTPCANSKKDQYLRQEKKRKATVDLSTATPQSNHRRKGIHGRLSSGFQALMTPLQNTFSRKKKSPECNDKNGDLDSPPAKRRRVENNNLSPLISKTESPLATSARDDDPSSNSLLAEHNEDFTNPFSPTTFGTAANEPQEISSTSDDQNILSASSSGSSNLLAEATRYTNEDNNASLNLEYSTSLSSNLSDRQIRNIGNECYTRLLEKANNNPEVFAKAIEFVKRKSRKELLLPGLALSSIERSKDDEINAEIVHNISDYLNHKMFKTKGRRKDTDKKALVTVLSSILPNKFGFIRMSGIEYCNGEYSTIKLPFSATMQCSSDTISGYHARFSGTSHYSSLVDGELVIPVLKEANDDKTGQNYSTIAFPFGTIQCTTEAIDTCGHDRLNSTTINEVQKALNFRSTHFKKAEEARTSMDDGVNLF